MIIVRPRPASAAPEHLPGVAAVAPFERSIHDAENSAGNPIGREGE
jgi:hypothetical protein